MFQAVQSFWQVFLANASGIQALAVIISLGWIGVQTWHLRKQLQLATITSMTLHFKELNELILTHENVAALLPEKPEFTAAALLLGTFESRFLLHEAGILDKEMWDADRRTMIDTFTKHPFMFDAFQDFGTEYPVSFQRFLRNEIIPRVPRQPSNQQTPKS